MIISSVLCGHLRPLECVALSKCNCVVSGSRGTIIVHSIKTGIVEYQADNVFLSIVSKVFAILWMAHLWLVGGMMVATA